ncbi:E3 ubiquitin-protein ligase RAD18 isoform X5 [Paramormyrops kingsleyae]|uniref:E3 ubiquitin-protein ligase RAD18 isoform X5 n=1 Tax=Paramormyrops kingsleyae TaxID=1676925 RepID=UPI003B97885D
MMSVVPEPDLPTNLACLKPVDALLRCPVCFDYTNIAMMTKCSHNFCSLCIRKFLSYKPQCPVCNSTATESDLRNNRILDDLVKSFKDARHKLTQTTFESPPISPKTPVSSVRRNAMKPGLSKVGGTILNHFFQKRSPTGSEQSRTPKVQKDSRQGQQNSAALVMSVKEEQVEVSAGGPMSSSAFPSSSASPNQKPAVKVECPVCNVGVPEQFINKHLDSCLSRDEKRESLRSSIVKRKPLPKLVYHLLSSQELKKRLRELHLSTQGPRVQLERRHQEFVHIYNSQCDSLSPQSVEDIAKEVERDEKLRNQPELKHPPAMVFSKTQTEEEIEEIHANYRKQHSAEFSRLISQVKGRWKSSKTAKVKEETQDGEEARGEHSPALNTECLNDLGSCSLVTAEAAVMSEVPPRSPSPALSSISISSSIVKRKPLPKLVYHLLSSQELKKRLRELHLSTQGPRVQLERRHQEFVHIYNSQCDSLSPQSVEDIAKEVERDEKLRNQPELKQPPAMVFSKTQTEEEIEEIHANYPLNTECLNDLGSCLLVTAEAAVMSKVPPRSPSPALSSISISSSISDVFSPEPKRKHDGSSRMRESTPSRKHMASSPQDADLAPLSTSDKRARWH